MSPYVVAKGSSPMSTASGRSVRSGRRRAAVRTSSPAPAAVNRTPAPSSGGTSSSPSLIATHVLDQMTTSIAYSDQTATRDTGRHGSGGLSAGAASARLLTEAAKGRGRAPAASHFALYRVEM